MWNSNPITSLHKSLYWLSLTNKLTSSSWDPSRSTVWLKPTILALSPTTPLLWPCVLVTLSCSPLPNSLCVFLPHTSFLFLYLLWLPCSSPPVKSWPIHRNSSEAQASFAQWSLLFGYFSCKVTWSFPPWMPLASIFGFCVVFTALLNANS